MKIRTRSLIVGIHDLIFEWQKCGLVSDSRSHQAFKKAKGLTEVTWGNDGYVLTDEPFSSLSEYCSLVENKQYSMLLMDGSIFQFSFTLKRDSIVKHRLCWYPAPIEISPKEINSSGLITAVMDRMSSGALECFRSRSPIRFDYSPDESSEDHPEVHLHINEECCRIPVKTPLSLRQFMVFIVDNFYGEIQANKNLHENVKTWDGKDCLTQNQKERFHVNQFSSILSAGV